MATNLYFNNYYSSADQQLYEALTIEAIKMYGHDVYYIPRTLNSFDPVYGEDDQSSYEKAYLIEMYIKNTSSFGGDGDFISQVAGLELRPKIVFSVARRTFESEVIKYTNQLRPNEGDLVFFTMNQRLFKILAVNKYEIFYQVGQLTTWELTCELFDYAGETFSTGIEEIDSITSLSTNVLNYTLLNENDDYIVDGSGNYLVIETTPSTASANSIFDDSDTIQTESDEFVDFTQEDPFSEGRI